MRPSKTAMWRLQDSGTERIVLAGRAHQRGRHRIGDVAAMRIGDRNGLRRQRRSGLIEYSFTLPPLSVTRISSVFLPRRDRGRIARRHEIAGHDAAARGAGALPAGEDFHKSGGHAARGGGIFVVGDVDDPGALAERDAGERRGVAGVELALRVGVDARAIREQQSRREASMSDDPKRRASESGTRSEILSQGRPPGATRPGPVIPRRPQGRTCPLGRHKSHARTGTPFVIGEECAVSVIRKTRCAVARLTPNAPCLYTSPASSRD